MLTNQGILNYKKLILGTMILNDMMLLLQIWRQIKGYSSNGQVMLASYSLAYKSHLLTVAGGFNEFGMNNSYTSGYRTIILVVWLVNQFGINI